MAQGDGGQGPGERNRFMGTFLIPCLGFALLRLYIMMLDGEQVYQSEYASFLVGNLARGCVPLLVVAFIGGRPLAARVMLRGFVPCALAAGGLGSAIVGGLLDEAPALLIAARGAAMALLGWMYVCWAEVYRYVKIPRRRPVDDRIDDRLVAAGVCVCGHAHAGGSRVRVCRSLRGGGDVRLV